MTLDIIVVIVLVVAVVLGFKVGFLTYVVKIASVFTGLLFTFILVNPVCDIVMASSIGESEIQTYIEKIESSEYYIEDMDDFDDLLVDVGIPSILASIISSMVLTDSTANDFVYSLSKMIATVSIWIKVFVIVLILTTLIFFLVKIFIKSIRKAKFIRVIDGIFGVVLSLALTFICGYTILSIITVVVDGGMFSVFGAYMNNQYDQSLGIYSYFFDHNFIYNFFELIFN